MSSRCHAHHANAERLQTIWLLQHQKMVSRCCHMSPHTRFYPPSGPHTPLDTSTAVGRARPAAVATLSGLRPPASSQPCLASCMGTCRLRQSSAWPEPPWGREAEVGAPFSRSSRGTMCAPLWREGHPLA